MGKLSIDDMTPLASKRGGVCLSKKYESAHKKLWWECNKGHEFQASQSNVKSGKWCPFCAGNKTKTLGDAKNFARLQGGKCLSRIYKTARTKMLWECAKGHRWRAIYDSVRRGHWCGKCAGVGKITLAEVRGLAGDRSGQFLSKNCKSSRRLRCLWRCSEGHEFEATWSDVKSGRWCPQCSQGIGERLCREAFEQLFEVPFPKGRPEWLLNSRGNQMELDGYSEKLGLAFEHQGEQHFRRVRFFHNKIGCSLRQRKADDREKLRLCNKHGVILIKVPQLLELLSLNDLKGYIALEGRSLGVQFPENFKNKEIDFRPAYASSRCSIFLRKIKNIIEGHKGKLLSNFYLNYHTKIEVECEAKHRWKVVPSSLFKGHWCAKCAWKQLGLQNRHTLEEVDLFAKRLGGRCLSSAYTDLKRKLLWECALNHRWKDNFGVIKKGKWCPQCANRKKRRGKRGTFLTLDHMHKTAALRGGKCLSKRYSNSRTKLLWECAKGHQWRSRPVTVRKGHWCPRCAAKANRAKVRLA